MVVTLQATTKHVGELLSSTLVEDRKKNHFMLLHILGVVRFLGRQGLALRGSALSSEVDGNFSQLLHLTNSVLVGFRENPTNILLLIYMQNEMLKVMSLRILRDITSKITPPPPTIYHQG